MAAPTLFSDQLAKLPPQTQNYTPLRPSELHGRVRIGYFSRSLLAEAQNSLIGLTIIPKNARILESKITTSATPGASVNFDLGLSARNGNGNIDDTSGATVADAPAYLGNFAPAGAAAKGVFADTAAFHQGYLTTKDLILTATVKTAAVTAASILAGYVLYVVD